MPATISRSLSLYIYILFIYLSVVSLRPDVRFCLSETDSENGKLKMKSPSSSSLPPPPHSSSSSSSSSCSPPSPPLLLLLLLLILLLIFLCKGYWENSLLLLSRLVFEAESVCFPPLSYGISINFSEIIRCIYFYSTWRVGLGGIPRF